MVYSTAVLFFSMNLREKMQASNNAEKNVIEDGMATLPPFLSANAIRYVLNWCRHFKACPD